jgi:hypothetical protein
MAAAEPLHVGAALVLAEAAAQTRPPLAVLFGLSF